MFAERAIPLGTALTEGAFGSAGDLEAFIDECVGYTATRPEMKALHDDATRVGPSILATRLDTEDAELERRGEEQRAQDRIAPLQLRAPLPMLQRAAVGEVAIPVARATTFAAWLARSVALDPRDGALGRRNHGRVPRGRRHPEEQNRRS